MVIQGVFFNWPPLNFLSVGIVFTLPDTYTFSDHRGGQSGTLTFDGKLFHFQPHSPLSVFGQGRTLRWCVSPAAGYCPLIRGSAILSLYCMPRISLVFVFGGNIFLRAQHLHLLSISRKPMFVEKSNFATRGFPVRQFTTGSKHHLFSPNIGEIV